MKKFLNLLLATPVAAVIMVACQSDEGITYSGPEYVMFSDTVYTMPVQDKEETFSVPVAATTTADYDRNYAVEIVNEKSTAVRGLHFDFVDNSNNITIKAGERVANVSLKGHYTNIAREDSLVVSLRLVEPKAQEWNLYGNTTRVDLVKCPPFKMNEFLKIKKEDDKVNLIMLASFPFDSSMGQYSAHGYKKDDHTLILMDMFGESSSEKIRIIFDEKDPLDLRITVPEQAAFRESNYGYVWVRSVEQYPSYFNTFDNFFVLILEAYVPQIGSFGVYQYIFECIDADEEADNNNGAATRGFSSYTSTFKLNKY